MLKEAKRLHALGFAVHWLKPSSKLPVDAGWTKGDRKPWEYLHDNYRHGLNVGVRLGQASRIGDGYLAVIDCDVKSTEPRHQKELESALRAMFGDVVRSAPRVASGRGNGSAHVYVKTREPFKTYRLNQSPEKVRVHMPSARASRADAESLSPAEIESGYRMRAAWEISVMSEGSQVVVPPSLHPDSGEAYEWVRMVEKADDVPLIETPTGRAAKGEETVQDFTPVAVDLELTELPDKYLGMIRDGEGVTDKSASLFVAAIALLKAGFTDNEVLTVLTDREYFLGETAYSHANTTSRKRAAEWVRKYTLARARRETLAEEQFRDDCETVTLGEAETAAQTTALGLNDWRRKLTRIGGKEENPPQPTLLNVRRILRGEAGDAVFMRDEFAARDIYGVEPPWGGREGAEIRDIDIIRIKTWFGKQWRMEPSNDKLHEAVSKIADENRFHPVREYLDSLEWDGKPRLDTWLADYIEGDAPEPYLSAVSRKTLCAMVARVYQPGVKFDHVLILEGDQGVGKSTALRILAGDDWFTDAPLDLKNKDTALSLRSKWIYEIGELAGMHRSDVASLKAFITTQGDYLRAPFGRRAETYLRQCIFIGTVNPEEGYLKDPTGNRRFWPVRVGRCNFEKLARDRDQLFAEARFAWEMGEALYLETQAMQAGAIQEQSDRVWQDEWVTLVSEFLAKEHENFNVENFTISDMFGDFGGMAMARPSVSDQMRMAGVLKNLGYKKVRERGNGLRRVVWKK